MRRITPILAAVVLIAGCASASRDAGFPQVRAEVEQRLNVRAHWIQGTPEDVQVAKSIRELFTEPLTADAAVQVALLNNRRLQATYESLGVAQGEIVQEGLLENPVFHGGMLTPLSHEEEVRDTSARLALEVEWDFLSLFTSRMRRSIARSEFEEAKLTVTASVLDLAAETRSMYYRAVADEQSVEMTRQIAYAAETAADFAQRLRDVGNIPLLDLQRQQAFVGETKLALAMAEAAAYDSRERLNALMGLWGNDLDWEIAARLPDIPDEEIALNDLEARAVERSVDLALARQRIVSVGERLGAANATKLVPSLDIGGELERDGGEWEAGPQMTLPLPVFNRGQGRIAGAESEIRRLQADYYALAVESRSAARRAERRLQVARDKALFYRDDALPLQANILDQTQLQYNAMQIGVTRLLEAKQRQIEAGRLYVEALYDYWSARHAVDQLLSGRMTDAMPVSGDRGVSMPTNEGGH